jgi:hypothetical protein
VIELLKSKFVCVAVDARKERGEYKDADGDFVRATNCVTVTASGSICVVTAGGKALGPYSGPGREMVKWLQSKLKAWEALPEADRTTDRSAVKSDQNVDPRRAALALPNGALVIRVFNRHLGWDEKKSIRYAIADDYLPGTSKVEAERYAMAQNDFMWVPEKEWRALIPSDPHMGQSVEVPASFALRLFRWHLDPARGFTEGANFAASRAADGKLTMTVQEVSPNKLRLALVGHADLKQTGRDEVATFRPALFGYIEIDRPSSMFTRFDVVALGTASGLPTDANGKVAFRKGEYPVGIAFELVKNPTPAEKLHPRGARDNPTAYLEPKERK